MKNRFYMACTRDNIGANMAWHGSCGGYTSDVNKAEVLNRDQAQEKWDRLRDIDIPISADHVDQLLKYKVDMQYIPSDSLIDDSETYVVFIDNKYCGNDRFFITDTIPSTDFSLARVINKSDIKIQEGISYIPFSLADKEKRQTFDFSHYNPRTMTQGAGLRIPDYIKKQRRRAANSGKHRWNCPACGKISWQYNPYDFDGCLDRSCSEYQF